MLEPVEEMERKGKLLFGTQRMKQILVFNAGSCFSVTSLLFFSFGLRVPTSVLVSFLGVATAALASIFKIKPASVNLGTPFKKNKTKTKSDFFIWCLRILLETKYRRLPVVDSEGKLVSEIDVYSPSPLQLIYYYVF